MHKVRHSWIDRSSKICSLSLFNHLFCPPSIIILCIPFRFLTFRFVIFIESVSFWIGFICATVCNVSIFVYVGTDFVCIWHQTLGMCTETLHINIEATTAIWLQQNRTSIVSIGAYRRVWLIHFHCLCKHMCIERSPASSQKQTKEFPNKLKTDLVLFIVRMRQFLALIPLVFCIEKRKKNPIEHWFVWSLQSVHKHANEIHKRIT